MKKQQYYGEDKLFLTFSIQDTLSYSTILQNIMIMLIHDDSDELLSNAEAYETLENLSKEDYDDLHDRAENLYSDFGIQRYLDRRGIYIGMALCKLGEDEVESFRDDISEIMSWSEFEDYELDDVEW